MRIGIYSPIRPRPQARPRRILIADDERVIADTLAVILRNAGYETAVARNVTNPSNLIWWSAT